MHALTNETEVVGAGGWEVYLTRTTDGFKIPYRRIKSITLIALLRMGLLPEVWKNGRCSQWARRRGGVCERGGEAGRWNCWNVAAFQRGRAGLAGWLAGRCHVCGSAVSRVVECHVRAGCLGNP